MKSFKICRHLVCIHVSLIAIVTVRFIKFLYFHFYVVVNTFDDFCSYQGANIIFALHKA